MIVTDANKKTLKQLKNAEREKQDAELKARCEAIAIERIGSEDALKQLSNASKGLWYMPIINDDESIEKMLIMKPIDRHILSLASTKIEDEGLYLFLEACMRECTIEAHDGKQLSDMEIIEDDDYFIPAAMKFNKIMENKKVAFLKR
jgi:hypothetical protein